MARKSRNRALEIIRKHHFPGITRVAEGGLKLVVEVHPEDLIGASRKDPGHCAFAVACERALSVDGALISRRVAYVMQDQTAVRFRVSAPLKAALEAFDETGKFPIGKYSLLPFSEPDTLVVQKARQQKQRSHQPRGIKPFVTQKRRKLVGVRTF